MPYDLGDQTLGTQGYQTLLNQILQQGSGAGWNMNNTQDKLGGMGQQFQGLFQNMMGRAPTAQEMSQMFSSVGENVLQSPGGYGGTNYTDMQNLMNPYIQNTYGPQIQQAQQDAETKQLNNSQDLVQNLVQKTMQNTAGQLSDPQSKIYQTLAGSMNNMGITPSSGAFQAGAGSTIANSGMEAATAGLQAVGLPQISGIANTANAPYQNAMQNMNGNLQSYGNRQGSMYDFQLQSALGQKLAEMSQPSTAQKDIGMASGAANAVGGLGKGMAGASQLTSYVCKELIRHGLLCDSDMDDFHAHIMPAMFKKGRAFWKYAIDGKKLVDAVNARGLQWKHFKPLLFDRVMEEPDACKAVDLYADACHQLCISADRTLWDGRVYRSSFMDSLPFLPFLFLYTPFMKALWKCLRIKMLIIYDKPRCEHGIR